MSLLFEPYQLGALELPNRLVMAPLTRGRSTNDRVPVPLMAEYYAQRAGAGLIVSEATSITAQGVGYSNTPGIWSPEQVTGWRVVTDAVRAAGGRIFLQLWHVGRVSHSDFLDGAKPVSASAVQRAGDLTTPLGRKPYETPRALLLEELPGIVADYRHAAVNALEAGFHGVEIHGANGYLLDQFLRDGTNHRTDAYGGSIENRARLMLEVTDTVVDVWGKDRVGIRLSPADELEMSDSDPRATFGFVARELGGRGLTYLHVREKVAAEPRIGPELKSAFQAAGGGAYMANEKFDQATAESVLATGEADLIAFGVPYIANPDLADRYRTSSPLNPPHMETFYGGGAEGYTDYPSLANTDARTLQPVA